ncbi:MAG: DHH family phosphoesterase [Bacilli bacterium]|jgi:single-stranded-DNA-specific exonuclease
MTFLQKLLDYYQLDESAYARLVRPLSEDDLPRRDDFEDLGRIVARIHRAIFDHEKIVIYGDYDADGVLATSILVDAFKRMDYDVGYYVPNRYQDGYGLQVGKVQEISDKGYRLIITVDNGVNAHEAVTKAYELDLEVILTDHHEFSADIPRNEGVLHPFISKNPFPYCGAVMALILSRALLGHLEPYHLALASIATISDMMPLYNGNRDLVRLGLSVMNEKKFSTINLLAEGQPIDENLIAMTIAPSINAIGRLTENSTINRLVKYFISEDIAEQMTLANWIKETNRSRKELTHSAIITLPSLEGEETAIVHLSHEKEGLIGLLANRLVNQYERPVVVFTLDSSDPSLLIGSARTPLGYNLIEAFEKLRSYFIKGGGHANAGGLTIEVSRYDDFKAAFIKHFTEVKVDRITPASILIGLQEFSFENYEILRSLSPFGQGFKAPIFRFEGLRTDQLHFIKDGRYLATPLGFDRKILGFGVSKAKIGNANSINLNGFLKVQTYKSRPELVFMVQSFD